VGSSGEPSRFLASADFFRRGGVVESQRFIQSPSTSPELAMSDPSDRRTFLQASAVLGVGGLGFLDALPAVARDDAKLDPKLVRLDSDIDPLVRLLEDTPREKLLEEVGGRVKKGLAYREVLAALLLAGVRNIKPRPNVGFKFHAVMVVNSAHQAALAGPDKERWLPLFWALDNFKGAQATNVKETNGWRMGPVDEAHIPPARDAKTAFADAMTNWDEAKADVAAASVARHCTENEAFDLLKHDEKGKPAGDKPADVVGIRNAELARKLGAGWREGKADAEAARELLATIRQGTFAEVSDKVVERVNGGLSPQSVWDAVFLGAGELLMRQPGIVGLHTLTTANALRYAYGATGDDDTRKVLMLQAASFLPMFRNQMGAKVGDDRIDMLSARQEDREFSVKDVYAELTKSKPLAAQTAFTVLSGKPGAAKELIDAGRLLVFLKGTDSHDYKFSSAVMEDAANVSPAWRNQFLAASVFWLKGSGSPDAAVVKRTRAALA
jgi:hypothetical protein